MKKSILYSITSMTLIYLAYAFGNWDYNPGCWDIEARSICAAFMLVSGSITMILSENIYKN